MNLLGKTYHYECIYESTKTYLPQINRSCFANLNILLIMTGYGIDTFIDLQRCEYFHPLL